MSEVTQPAAPWKRFEGWRAAVAWALILTVALRIGVGLAMAVAWGTIRPHVAPSLLNNPAIYGEIDIPVSFPADALLGVWPRWDAIHHLNLALLGYSGAPPGDSVFYPLFALLTRVFAHLVGGDVILSGLLVATLAAVASLAGLYRLADTFFGPGTAQWSALALATFPTAIFLVAPFTESLFLALTVGAFLACYRGRWWLAGALGFLASLARGPGMLSALAFAIIAWQGWRRSTLPLLRYWRIPILACIALPVVGGVSFLVWREAAGLASVPETLQHYSGLVLTNPVSGLVESVRQWFRVRDFTTTVEVITALTFIALTVAMFANPRWRKAEWLAYVVANLALFLSKQSLTASSLQSLPRYVLMLFPIFIAIGDWLAQRGRRTQFAYLVGSSSALVVFSMLYALWVFIG